MIDTWFYTEPLITHAYPLSKIEEAYDLFENKRDGVIKVAVECWDRTSIRKERSESLCLL